MASSGTASVAEAPLDEEDRDEQDLLCIRENLRDIDVLLGVVTETQQHSRLQDCVQYQELLQERLFDIASKLENMASVDVCANGNSNKFSSIMHKLQARAMSKPMRGKNGKKRKASVFAQSLPMPGASTPAPHAPLPPKGLLVCARCRKNHKSAQYCRVEQKHTGPAWNLVPATCRAAVAQAGTRPTATTAVAAAAGTAAVAAAAGSAAPSAASIATAPMSQTHKRVDAPLATKTDGIRMHTEPSASAARPSATAATATATATATGAKTSFTRAWI